MPISGETVRRLACDGSITRVVLGSESVVIDVGRAKRVVAGTTRRALDARDRQCQWPGCDRPPSWTAAHHLVHWARGGDTNLSNMVLLCHRHHWLAHEGRWQLVRTDDGRLLTIPPRPWLFSQVRAPDETGAA
jgi:HNH endonuclease